MTDSDVAIIAIKALDEKQGINIETIDIEQVSTLGHFLVVCEASSTTQVKALSDIVEYKLGAAGVKPLHIEGYQTASWILLDYGQVMIHIFHRDQRQFYSLEKLWADGTVVDLATVK